MLVESMGVGNLKANYLQHDFVIQRVSEKSTLILTSDRSR
jgi:hypothetical protein